MSGGIQGLSNQELLNLLSDDELLQLGSDTPQQPLTGTGEPVSDVSDDDRATSLSNLAKNIIAKTPVSRNKALKIAERTITGFQLAASPLPTSPLTAAMGEGAKALLRGKSVEEALKEAGKAAGIDASLRAAFAGLPAPLTKSLIRLAGAKSKVGTRVARKVKEVSVSGAAKKLLRKQAAGQGLNDIVVEKVAKNPNLFIKPKESAVVLQNRAFKGINNVRNELGAQVGEAKRLASASGEVINDSSIVSKLSKELAKFAEKPGVIPKVDIPGKRALEVVNKELSRKGVKSLSEGTRILENIDSSSAFRKIYKAQKDGIKLTGGEAAALKLRGELGNTVHKKTAEVLAEKAPGLIQSKEAFIEVANAMDTVKRTGISKKNIGKLLRESAHRDNEELFKAFTILDNKSSIKFLDKSLSRTIDDTLFLIRDNISLLRLAFTNLGTRTAAVPGPIARTAGAVGRQAAVESLADRSPSIGLNESITRNTLR